MLNGGAVFTMMRDVSELVEVERTCTRCHLTKPIDDFGPLRYGRGGRAPHCRPCDTRRKREGERARHDPESRPAVNRAVKRAPDPEPAKRLRRELHRQRDAGRPFGSAWSFALNVAVRDLSPVEQADWREAFTAMRDIWQASYSRQPWPTSCPHAPFVADEDRGAPLLAVA